MQNKDKGDGIEDSPLDMILVILLDGASKEVVMSSGQIFSNAAFSSSSLSTFPYNSSTFSRPPSFTSLL